MNFLPLFKECLVRVMAWCSEMVLCHSSWWLKTEWLPFWLKCFLLSTNKHQAWTRPASIKRVCLSNLLRHLAAVNTEWPCRRYRCYFVKWFSAVRSSQVKLQASLFVFVPAVHSLLMQMSRHYIPQRPSPGAESPVSPCNPPLFG